MSEICLGQESMPMDVKNTTAADVIVCMCVCSSRPRHNPYIRRRQHLSSTLDGNNKRRKKTFLISVRTSPRPRTKNHMGSSRTFVSHMRTLDLFADGAGGAAGGATGVPSSLTISPSTSASNVAGVGTNPFVSTTAALATRC